MPEDKYPTSFHKFDQEARIAFMEHYATHLRYWGTNLLALGAGLIATFGAQKFLVPYGLLWVVVGGIVSQAFYAILRLICYGESCRCILEVRLGKGETHLSRLSQGVIDHLKNKPIYKYLWRLHGLKAWFSWTLAATLIATLSLQIIFQGDPSLLPMTTIVSVLVLIYAFDP